MSLQETKQAVLDTIKFAAYLCSIVIHTVSLLAFSNSVTLDGMEESDLIVSLSVSILQHEVVLSCPVTT